MDTITLQAYADAVGISRQAVYKRIKSGKLADYVVMVEGVKMLDKSVLDATTCKPSCKPPVNQVANQFTQQDTHQNPSKMADIIAQQQQTIKDLTEQINALQRHILSQSETLTEALQKSQELQNQLHQIMIIPALQEMNSCKPVCDQVDNQVDNQNQSAPAPENGIRKALQFLARRKR